MILALILSMINRRVGSPAPTGTFNYLRPGGVDTYLRPGGVDTYKRP